jgi:flagellar hook-associated protein 2
MDVVTAGRGTVDIEASDSGGQLSLVHQEYGSADGLEVSFLAGGADGTASLGVGAGTYAGQDVQGTIGGLAATGAGQILTGDDDTSVAGLMIRYEGADTGLVGTLTFSRGIASAMEARTDLLLGSENGSIDALVANIDPLVDRLNDRINTLEGRLERRREFLIAKFARLEEALALAQSQSQWLTAQFANLPSYSASKD